MNWLDFRSNLISPSKQQLEDYVNQELLPPALKSSGDFKVVSIVPRAKDGGMFVHFTSSYDPLTVQRQIRQYLKETKPKAWFNQQAVRPFLVHVSID